MQAHAVEAADDEIAALLVALTHVLVGTGAHLERLQPGHLAHDRSAEHAVLMNLHHRLAQRCRSAGVAKTPAGHGEGLAEAVQQDGALAHPGILDDALVLTSVVKQLAVDLVGEDDQVVLHGQRGDFFQLRFRHDAAGGIRGEVHRQDLGLRRDGLFHILGHEGEFVFLTCLHDDGDAVGHLDAGRVADVAGLVIDHLVPRIQYRTEGDVERLGDADGDEDLRLGIVGHAELLLNVLADRHAQRFEAEVGGVARLALFERANHRLADRPRRRFVRLADAKGNDIAATDDEFEKVANAGARQIADDL